VNQPIRRRVRNVVERSATICLAISLGAGGIAAASLHATTAAASVTYKTGADETRATSLAPRDVAPGTWDTATELPGMATLNLGLNAGVYSISCSSAGLCSAGGNYTDASNHSQGFVVNEIGGVWGTAIEVPGSGALNAGGNATVWSVSCSSAGNCGAAGMYTDSATDVRGFVVNETGGTWGAASEVLDPSAISCTATGGCTAAGDDVVAGGSSVGFAVSETGGQWGNAIEITMTSQFGRGGTSLDNVVCTSPGNCSAAGNGLYPDTAISGGFADIPFESDEIDGSWSTSIDFPGLATLNVGDQADSSAISCSSPGNCSAGGLYEDATKHSGAWVANETSGTWSDAIQVPGYSTYNHGDAGLNSISCPLNGFCAATGFYTSELGKPVGFIVLEDTGAWNSAYAVTFEAGPYADGTGSSGISVSCSVSYVCAIAGVSFQSSGNAQSFVELALPGGQFAVVIPGTGALNTDGDGYASSISCSADSSCAVGGWYSTGTNDFQAFTSDMTPAFLTQAALHITATHGTVGTFLALSTSGGSGLGPVSYTVSNGSAGGCAVSDGFLSATTAGTCLVTATKGIDGTYLPISSTSAVEMNYPPKPHPLTIDFKSQSAALNTVAKKALYKLSRQLITGALLTITGYARGDAKLARSRALNVRTTLGVVYGLRVTVKTNTSVGINSATVVTNKE
jgi:hypothetical protein